MFRFFTLSSYIHPFEIKILLNGKLFYWFHSGFWKLRSILIVDAVDFVHMELIKPCSYSHLRTAYDNVGGSFTMRWNKKLQKCHPIMSLAITLKVNLKADITNKSVSIFNYRFLFGREKISKWMASEISQWISFRDAKIEDLVTSVLIRAASLTK